MVPKNIVRIMLLVSFVLASACGRQLAPLDFTQPSRSQLLITSTSGLERSIHLHSYIYQPIDANEATTKVAIAHQLRTVVGPLRAKRVAIDHRDPMQGVTIEWKSKEVLTVRNADHPAQTVQRIHFRYDGRAVVSNELKDVNSIDVTLLMGAYETRGTPFFLECADVPFTDTLWYYFEPERPSCRLIINAEQRLIAEAENRPHTHDPVGTVSTLEVERLFQNVSAQLGPVVTDEHQHSPEYQRIFGNENNRSKVVFYFISGSDDGMNFSNDRYFTEYLGALREISQAHPQLLAKQISDDKPFLDIGLDGTPIAGLTYQDLFNWLLDNRGFPISIGSNRASMDSLRTMARDKFVGKWIYWSFPIEVTDYSRGESRIRKMDLEIRSYYGDEAGRIGVEDEAQLRYQEAFREGDVIIYNGHSHLGAGAFDPSRFRPENFDTHYQLLFFNSCSSFQYFNNEFMKLKPGGSQNLDVITNGLETAISHSGRAIASFAEGLLKMQDFRSLLTSMRQAEGGESDGMRIVDGDLDNVFAPRRFPIAVKPVPR